MSIAKELMALEAVPFLRLLGTEALRVLAIGSEVKDVRDGEILFSKGDPADCGYVVVEGSFRVSCSGCIRSTYIQTQGGQGYSPAWS